jgi:hypothetical protein
VRGATHSSDYDISVCVCVYRLGSAGKVAVAEAPTLVVIPTVQACAMLQVPRVYVRVCVHTHTSFHNSHSYVQKIEMLQACVCMYVCRKVKCRSRACYMHTSAVRGMHDDD